MSDEQGHGAHVREVKMMVGGTRRPDYVPPVCAKGTQLCCNASHPRGKCLPMPPPRNALEGGEHVGSWRLSCVGHFTAVLNRPLGKHTVDLVYARSMWRLIAGITSPIMSPITVHLDGDKRVRMV